MNEIVELLKEVVAHDGGVRYEREDDEIGTRCCCHVTDYKPHLDTCFVPRAVALLAGMQAATEAHCATCSCVPGMTPAIRFDTTPAEREGAVRAHLIRMGWTPPTDASAPQSAPVEVEQLASWMINNLLNESQLSVVPPGHQKALRYLARQPAPSAPVGAEGLRQAIEILRKTQAALSRHFDNTCDGTEIKVALEARAFIAQQPAPSAPVRVEAAAIERAIAEIESGDFGGGVSDACLQAMKSAIAQQPAAAGGATRPTKWRCGFCGGAYYLPSPSGRFCCEAQAKFRAAQYSDIVSDGGMDPRR